MKLVAPHTLIDAAVELPSSKSISNRLLILRELAGEGVITNISEAEDTRILQRILSEKPAMADVGHAGTAFRFLTAFLAMSQGEFVLTGSHRMRHRPVGVLVEALRGLGADIHYLEHDGYPPLRIRGKELIGGKIELESGTSSQYVSALMMIAPYLKNGIDLVLRGEIVSEPYIEMTAGLMRLCGAEVEYIGNRIRVHSGNYVINHVVVEYDWSAVGFWMSWVAVAKMPHMLIRRIRKESIQGDVHSVELFRYLGVESEFDEKGLHLRYTEKAQNLPETLDFTDTPDLVQPFAVAAAVMGKKIKITGIGNLRIKETNRLRALQTELENVGAQVEVGTDWLEIQRGVDTKKPRFVRIQTYDDHRMAMAFSPLAVVYGKMEIEHPEVVKKSYPQFWNELQKLVVVLE